MRACRAGFTLTELMAVVVLLAILAGVAVPRFIDRSDDAKRATVEAVVAGVRTGLGMTHLAYLAGDTAGLPPDANGDNYPDNLLFITVPW